MGQTNAQMNRPKMTPVISKKPVTYKLILCRAPAKKYCIAPNGQETAAAGQE
jgi:hypothetical protein